MIFKKINNPIKLEDLSALDSKIMKKRIERQEKAKSKDIKRQVRKANKEIRRGLKFGYNHVALNFKDGFTTDIIPIFESYGYKVEHVWNCASEFTRIKILLKDTLK